MQLVDLEVKRAVCWIRRDIRLYDHAALAEATRLAKEVLVVFVFDKLILDELKDRSDKRLTFIYESLESLRSELKAAGSELAILHGNPVALIPDLVEKYQAEGLFFNHDDEPYALKRDAEVTQICNKKGIEVRSFKDHVVYQRAEILNLSGEPFKVFTPYSKGWMNRFSPADILEKAVDLTKLAPKSSFFEENTPWKNIEELGFSRSGLWLKAGTEGGIERLNNFIKHVDFYKTERDFPDREGTSGLSVHLRHGTISIRHCFRIGMALDSNGAQKWVSELIWREFYMMIMSQFPHVVKGAFRHDLNDINWPGTDEHFRAWCEGKTGYPLVDAAMRCLNETGWMHNRLRMVAAMFLTKDLLVHWQKGEEYFAEKLLDFELASNNGGWQWSASTGVDSQPYFRIFNPLLQSQKFDPEAKFISEWCPELADFDLKHKHWPHDATLVEQLSAGCEIGIQYPAPLVNHQEQKEKAMALFKVQ